MFNVDRSDFSEDEAKQVSRELNFAQVMRCPHLFNQRAGTLRCDWIELPGTNAPTFQLLLERGWLKDARFFGPENDEDVFADLCEKFGERGPHHQFFPQAAHLFLRGRHAQRCGVYNFDSFHLARDSAFRISLRQAWAFASLQEKRLGNFALIINVGLTRGGNLDEFRSALWEVGEHKLDEDLLERPGVLYGADRVKHKSARVNYPVLFGTVTQERR